MNLSEPDLVVGRNFAHVWELVKKYPHVEVVDAGTFFHRVGLLAFVTHEDLRRDDTAAFVNAQAILASTKKYPLSLVKNFSSLHSACLHGGCELSQVKDRFVHASEPLKKVIDMAALMEENMARRSLVTNACALFKAWENVRDQKMVPPALVHTPRVSLHHLVDLTRLQIHVIKEMSRLGMRFELVMPADFRDKSLNASADFLIQEFLSQNDYPNIAVRFENIAHQGPLKVLVSNLFDDDASVKLASKNCTVFTADRVDDEAQHIAQKIAQIKTHTPDESIALVVRSGDARLEVYQRALVRHNIAISDRRGRPLINSSCGILLSTLFSARLSHLSRKDLVGLLQHEMFAHYLENPADRAWLNTLFNQIGVDDNITHNELGCRYLAKLEKYRRFLGDESTEIARVDQAKELISNIKNVLYLLKNEDSFFGFLSAVEQILQNSTTKKALDNSFYAVSTLISSLKNSLAVCGDDRHKITLNEFYSLLKYLLQSKTILHGNNKQHNAVEILLLPDMLGRSFNHVFIADMAFGRIPQNLAQDALINDELRAELNTVLQAPVLPLFFDDPFEPRAVPPIQSREPFWLACAIAGAENSIAFSYARYDLGGKEQAASEFFIWLKKNIKLQTANLHGAEKFYSLEDVRFWQGKMDRYAQPIPLPLAYQALVQRKLAFQEQTTGEFAFGFAAQAVCESFSGRIGEKSFRALTPTFIEAFSSCSFKGFYQRILQIDESSNDHDDTDTRAQGTIAHKTLEIYFSTHPQTNDKKEVTEKVASILQDVTKEYCQKNFIKNDDLFFCQIEWLNEALVNLVMDILEQYPSARLRLPKREVPLGLGKSIFPPLQVEFNQQKYFLGGVADRIDDVDGNFVVMDYKLSSLANLRGATSLDALLKTHFQMPVYLRLVSKHFARDERDKVSFVFASIRDGVLLKPVTFHKNHKLFDLIFNDDDPEGLAAKIDAVFSPIALGKVLPSVGDGCSFCNFSQICRKDEVS